MDSKNYEKFSIIVPFRGTEKEKAFALKSIPSMIRLKPNEIVIGMDKPVAESTLKFLRNLFVRWEFEDYRIVEVSQSNDWNFHAAHVVWECYKACRYDRVLETNIDVVLRPAMLSGLSLVGRHGISSVGYKRLPLFTSMQDRVRYALGLMLDRNLKFYGLSCVWRPCYFAAINLSKFKGIRNGWDTFTYECMIAKGYRIVMNKEAGGQSLDVENPHLPWRQFAVGVWLYAHPENIGQTRNKTIRRLLHATNRWLPLSVYARTLRYQKPYMITGYKWAKAHPEHNTVRTAAQLSYPEWVYTGSEHIKDLMDWASIGKTGTGFD